MTSRKELISNVYTRYSNLKNSTISVVKNSVFNHPAETLSTTGYYLGAMARSLFNIVPLTTIASTIGITSYIDSKAKSTSGTINSGLLLAAGTMGDFAARLELMKEQVIEDRADDEYIARAATELSGVSVAITLFYTAAIISSVNKKLNTEQQQPEKGVAELNYTTKHNNKI